MPCSLRALALLRASALPHPLMQPCICTEGADRLWDGTCPQAGALGLPYTSHPSLEPQLTQEPSEWALTAGKESSPRDRASCSSWIFGTGSKLSLLGVRAFFLST